MSVNQWWDGTDRCKGNTHTKTCPSANFPSQIQPELNQDWTGSSAVKNRRITDWAMENPLDFWLQFFLPMRPSVTLCCVNMEMAII